MGDTVDKDQVVEVIPCSSAEEFIRELTLSHEQWHLDTSENKTDARLFRSPWLFRGQGDAEWELRPSAWRSKEDSKIFHDFLDKIASYAPEGVNTDFVNRLAEAWNVPRSDEKAERISTAIKQAFAEFELVHRFIDLADNARLQTPDNLPIPNWKDFYFPLPFFTEMSKSLVVRDIVTFFLTAHRGEGYELYPFFAPDSLAVALAQHHGIPTRLLDWTQDPFTAAFFAAEKKVDASDLAVWAIHRNVHVGDFVEIFSPPKHLVGFLSAQQGVFTFMPDTAKNSFSPSNHFIDSGRWPSLEEKVPSYLRKITLRTSERDKLLVLLRNHNRRLSSLKPTFDNVITDLLKNEWELKSVFGDTTGDDVMGGSW